MVAEGLTDALSAFSEWDRTRKLSPWYRDGRNVSGDFVKIAAGPPTLKMPHSTSLTGDNLVFPLGLVQGVGIQASTPQMTVYELGSKGEYVISGRPAIQVNFGSLYLWGPNLIRSLYGWKEDNPPGSVSQRWDKMWDIPNYYQDDLTIHVAPGDKSFWINPYSDLFTRPIGLLLMVEDNTEKAISALYLERCYINGWGMDIDPNGMIMRENVSVTPHNVVPVNVNSADIWDEIVSKANDFLKGRD
jgi:hypothetical protein